MIALTGWWTIGSVLEVDTLCVWNESQRWLICTSPCQSGLWQSLIKVYCSEWADSVEARSPVVHLYFFILSNKKLPLKVVVAISSPAFCFFLLCTWCLGFYSSVPPLCRHLFLSSPALLWDWTSQGLFHAACLHRKAEASEGRPRPRQKLAKHLLCIRDLLLLSWFVFSDL